MNIFIKLKKAIIKKYINLNFDQIEYKKKKIQYFK